MASIHRRRDRQCWRVSWVRLDGIRAHRTFRSRDEADTFASSLDERRGRPGPDRVEWTHEAVRARIERSIVIDEHGCWIWQPRGGSNGYAQAVRRTETGSRTVLMHRASYEAYVGPIPDGLTIDHLCAVPKCVNPEHLEPVTQGENNRRRSARLAAKAVAA